jgi:hypothetical protein
MAGLILAGGYAIGAAIPKISASFTSDVFNVALGITVWLFVVTIVRLAFNQIIVSRDRFTVEVVTDHNWALGLFDGLLYIAVTAAFVSIHG